MSDNVIYTTKTTQIIELRRDGLCLLKMEYDPTTEEMTIGIPTKELVISKDEMVQLDEMLGYIVDQ